MTNWEEGCTKEFGGRHMGLIPMCVFHSHQTQTPPTFTTKNSERERKEGKKKRTKRGRRRRERKLGKLNPKTRRSH